VFHLTVQIVVTYHRIHKYACCSNECFILALIYIDRLIQRNNFLLTELNVHRVVITAVLLAAKFFDDAYYNNAYYSKVGGVMVSEMNGLEVDFLFRINFSLHVQPEVFDKYKAELVAHGLAISTLPTLLPRIPEVEICNSGVNSPDLMQHHQQQHQFVHSTSTSIPMMAPPVHVTPASNANEMASHMAMSVGPLQPPPAPISMLHNLLYVPGTGLSEQQILDAGSGDGAAISSAEIQQQHDLLQRANSLPPFSSGVRCVDHARYPPYHSAPTPMAPVLPLVNVDSEQYRLMMNQLFPIQTTLMHHNHGVAAAAATSAHHPNVVMDNTHHQGYLQGTGMGDGSSLVANY
jgi:hypothetical protein